MSDEPGRSGTSPLAPNGRPKHWEETPGKREFRTPVPDLGPDPAPSKFAQMIAAKRMATEAAITEAAPHR